MPRLSSFFLFQPFSFFLLQRRTSLPFSVSVSAPLLLFLPAFLFFSTHVCPFFQPKNILFNPKQFSLWPKNIFLAQTFFNPNVFQFFSPNVFASVQPLFSSSSFFCFILFWFNPLFSLSAPPFFLFFSSVYPRPNILSSCFTSLLFE